MGRWWDRNVSSVPALMVHKPISSWQTCPCPADSTLAAFSVIFAAAPADTNMPWAAAVCCSFVWMLDDGVKKCLALFSNVRPYKPLVSAHYLLGAPLASSACHTMVQLCLPLWLFTHQMCSNTGICGKLFYIDCWI